jgi:hypothetical protein
MVDFRYPFSKERNAIWPLEELVYRFREEDFARLYSISV